MVWGGKRPRILVNFGVGEINMEWKWTRKWIHKRTFWVWQLYDDDDETGKQNLSVSLKKDTMDMCSNHRTFTFSRVLERKKKVVWTFACQSSIYHWDTAFFCCCLLCHIHFILSTTIKTTFEEGQMDETCTQKSPQSGMMSCMRRGVMRMVR